MVIISENAPKKGLEEFNFNLESVFDVDQISVYAESLNEKWDLDTRRQDETYEDRRNPHIYTKTYIIQDHMLLWKFGTESTPIIKDEAAYNFVKSIVSYLEEEHVGQAARILLIKLEAGKDVSEHTDGGDYLSTVRRFHIPLITNNNVEYVVNKETVVMKKGECWEINNLKPHYVLNNSDVDRVHLLIDILPKYSFQSAPSEKVKIIDNFISEEDAKVFYDYMTKNHKNRDKFPATRGEIQKGRYRYEANIPETVSISAHLEIKDLIKKYSDKVVEEFKLFFGIETLYPSGFWMTILGLDTRLPWHKDNHIHSEHTSHSAVIYLNDDYDGGFLQFHDLDFTYKPKKLSVVIFSAEDVHRITRVRKGLRYALPVWATMDHEYDMFLEPTKIISDSQYYLKHFN